MSDPRALLRAALRADFLSFAERVFREIAAGETLVAGWPLEAICHALTEVAAGRRRRQIIAVPPRSLKSICASVALPAWILGHDPTAKIICVSYSGELAALFSAQCRQVMKSGWYRELFPGTTISPHKDSESYFRTTAGGYRDSTSVGGTLTGKGGNLIILDDPAKPDEALSEARRTAINNWYGSTLVSRLNDKVKGQILLVMQRLHVDDLVAHVLEREPWDMLSLPAIAEQDEVIPIGRGRTHHRREGEVLMPTREPLAYLEQQKVAMGTQAFSAQYQQRPIPLDGELVKRSWLQTYLRVREPPEVTIVQSWDTATKVTTGSDYSACVTAAKLKGDIYILDVHRARYDFPGLLHAVRALASQWRATALLIEDAGAGTSLMQQLRYDRHDGVPLPIPFTPRVDKLTRLATVSPRIEAGHVYLPQEAPWLGGFLNELLAFPAVKHDDQVDAFSQLLAWVTDREFVGEAVRLPMFGHRRPGQIWRIG